MDQQMDSLAFLSVSKTSLLKVYVTWLGVILPFEIVLGTNLLQSFHSSTTVSVHCI